MPRCRRVVRRACANVACARLNICHQSEVCVKRRQAASDFAAAATDIWNIARMKFNELLIFVRHAKVDEIKEYLNANPIEILLNAIPQSLNILHAIYTKFCDIGDKQDATVGLLKADKLVRHLVWWFTKQCDQRRGISGKKIVQIHTHADWKLLKAQIKSIMQVISFLNPKLMANLRDEQRQLFMCLESLGLHGLINFGSHALIDVAEAIRLELLDHQYRVKMFCFNVEQMLSSFAKEQQNTPHGLYSLNGAEGPAPTNASHQRLMSFRLSEIKKRLQRNEELCLMVRNSLHNFDLERLEEILQKRINYDQEILAQLNFLIRSNGSMHFTVAEDPVVSQILVIFSKGYEKLLKLSSDSVLLETGSSSTSSGTEELSIAVAPSPRSPAKPCVKKLTNPNCEHLPKSVSFDDKLYPGDRDLLLLSMDLKNPTTSLVIAFDKLATVERMSTMRQLDSMTELDNAFELRQKMLFFTIVVAFRSVKDEIKRIADSMWVAIGGEPAEPANQQSQTADKLHESLLQYLFDKAEKENFEHTYQNVSAQIWNTLPDFPSLQSCQQFCAFIRNCCRISWMLNSVANCSYKLHYNDAEFYDELHRRCQTSNTDSEQIKHFVWPGLVEIRNNCPNKIIYKAIVVT